MKRWILAYNPVSGSAAFKNKLDWMVESFQRRGCMLMMYRTQKDNTGAFVPFVKEAKADGILIAGGDGTLHEIVNFMLQADIHLPVGIIGSGTSNDFASYLKINEDMEAYFDAIVAGRMRRVDLGMVDGRYFVNVASAGMMTAIAHEVPPRLKNALGKLAYYLKGIGELPKFRSVPLKLTADGRIYELEAFLFIIINSSVVGSMKHVAAAASVDDGLLDFMAVRKCSIAELMKLTADLVSGKPVDKHAAVLHVQARDFLVETLENLLSDLDGEVGPMLPLQVTVVPGALDVYVCD